MAVIVVEAAELPGLARWARRQGAAAAVLGGFCAVTAVAGLVVPSWALGFVLARYAAAAVAAVGAVRALRVTRRFRGHASRAGGGPAVTWLPRARREGVPASPEDRRAARGIVAAELPQTVTAACNGVLYAAVGFGMAPLPARTPVGAVFSAAGAVMGVIALGLVAVALVGLRRLRREAQALAAADHDAGRTVRNDQFGREH